MIITAYIPELDVEEVLRVLKRLPSHLCPCRYSSSELKSTTKNEIRDEKKFQTFVNKNKHGFFLFAQNARYDITISSSSGLGSINVDPLGGELIEPEIVQILKAAAFAGSIFAFAANQDEYNHRNRYCKIIGVNQFETWLGRDINKYLPGIYWLCVFSINDSEVVHDLITTLEAEALRIDPSHFLVKTFDDSNQWQQYAARLDDYLVEHPKFFSKQRIIAELNSASRIDELIELAGQWS